MRLLLSQMMTMLKSKLNFQYQQFIIVSQFLNSTFSQSYQLFLHLLLFRPQHLPFNIQLLPQLNVLLIRFCIFFLNFPIKLLYYHFRLMPLVFHRFSILVHKLLNYAMLVLQSQQLACANPNGLQQYPLKQILSDLD